MTKVEQEAGTSNNALNARLLLQYSENAEGDTPPSLFLKLCKKTADNFGDGEVRYYTHIAAQMQNPPIPRCYHAAYDPTTEAYHLLLQDLSETHTNSWDIAPTLQGAKAIAESLAEMHAFWWDHPQLGEIVGRYPTRATIEKSMVFPDRGLEPMLTAAGEGISPAQCAFIREVFAKHRHAMQRRADTRSHLTFTHGDVNLGNILSPRSGQGRAILIDHQPFDWSLITWLGANDLSYWMVQWWETPVRREIEAAVLEHYHQHLEALGVVGYSLSALWEDYRLCAMQNLYTSAGWCVDPVERETCRWIWFPKLQRTLAACEEHRSHELLAPTSSHSPRLL